MPDLPMGRMLVVPVTRLYDQRHNRAAVHAAASAWPRPQLCLNPEEADSSAAERPGGENGEGSGRTEQREVLADVVVDETIPVGLCWSRAAVGLPISAWPLTS